MLFNFDFMIVLLAILVLGGLLSYTFYIIFSTVSNNFKLALVRLSSIGTVITNVIGTSTVVELSDSDLNSLLEVVFREIGNTTQIPVSLLNSLGLYTPTIIQYLISLGYTIIAG